MEEKHLTRRRWFQFSLRSFLIVITLVGFGGAWVGMQLQEKRRHEAVVNEITNLGGRIRFLKSKDVPAWKEWLFGSYAVKPVDLYLYNTDATDSVLSQTQGMNVFSLHLSSTKVTDVGLTHLKEMTSLEWLFLDNTRITDAGLANLANMTSLETLVLGNTQVTDAGLIHLTGLTGLTELYLSNTQVADAGLAHLNGLTSLEGLFLDDTQFTDAGLTHLKELTRLERLLLDHTQITDAGLTRLTGLTSLEYLDLYDTQVTDGGVDRLQKAIPSCKMKYFPKETTSASTP